MLWQCAKQPAAKKFFPLPNEIFSLGLSSGALAVYSYLLYCEDRKTYQCYPSYASIGKSVCMSVNTVRKYVAELEEVDMMAVILAEGFQFSEEDLRCRRAESVSNVKRTNGRISLEKYARGAWEDEDEWQD